MGVFGEGPQGLDQGPAAESEMRAGVVVVPELAGEGTLQVVTGRIPAEAVELLFVGLVGAFPRRRQARRTLPSRCASSSHACR